MSARAYYNEIDPFAADWLRNLIAEGLIPAGDVDTRSIADVAADDLVGYAQCHFFAGIGGWSLAARIAGWPDDRELWTGSRPCQPFSVAGKGAGTDDERHLWPYQLRLIRARRPAVWMGEQVAAAVGKDWLDGVLSDLEGIGYAGRAAVVPACAVDGPHRRDRLWIVAERGVHVADSAGARPQGSGAQWSSRQGQEGPALERDSQGVLGGAVGHADSSSAWRIARGISGAQGSAERSLRGEPDGSADAGSSGSSAWANAAWIVGHDGKARRVEPSIRLLAHGVPARVGRLRAYGNAIVPQVAAEVIGAYLDVRGAA